MEEQKGEQRSEGKESIKEQYKIVAEWLEHLGLAVTASVVRIGKSNGLFAPVSPGAHPRRPTARTPHRLFVPLPVPVGRLVSVAGQHEPWRMRRVLLGRPFCLPYPR